jgi:hypothetical protein
MGHLLAMPVCVRLGRNDFQGTNALAYLGSSSAMTESDLHDLDQGPIL